MKLTKRIAATAAAMVMAMSVVGMTAFASEPPAVGTSVSAVLRAADRAELALHDRLKLALVD